MAETYLVRAKLEVSPLETPTSRRLPAKFGRFTLDYSPNYKLALMQELGLEPEDVGIDPANVPSVNDDYPFSLVYIDTEIQVGKSYGGQYIVANDTLEQLEALFRVFKEGDVSIHRHNMWKLEGQSWVPDYGWLFLFRGTKAYGEFRPKPETIPLYGRKEYKLDDATLQEFVRFFDSYWDIVYKKPQPLYIAISRFSSSYEKRTLADRLVELMIAMEALFGSRTEVTFKIALRSAYLLYPGSPDAREGAFKTVKKLYDERSEIVHGKALTSKSDEERINQFEDYVRNSVLKFLQLYKEKHPISSAGLNKWELELDKMLFFTGSKNGQA